LTTQNVIILFLILLLLIACLGLVTALVYLFLRYRKLQANLPLLVQSEVNTYKQQDAEAIRNQARSIYNAQMQERISRWQRTTLLEETKRIRQEVTVERTAWAQNQLQSWVYEKEQSIRKDAIEKSKSVNAGRLTEQFALFMNGMEFNPKDARFLGHPVDFVVFDGLDEGNLQRVLFVEVKTGKSQMNARERLVREAIKNRQVEWVELKFDKPDDTIPSGGI
jgi:predicted Holliday junction resolvase-like endonuclease